MLFSILKRYPQLTENDVLLRDDSDGKGVYVEYWNSTEPKPTPTDLKTWQEEDMANYVPPKSMDEQLEEEKAKVRRLETQINMINTDLQGFMDFYFENQPL